MAIPLVSRRRQLLFGLESTAGTAVSLGTTAIHCENVRCVPDTQTIQFPTTTGAGNRGGVAGARSATVTFTVRATTVGSATEPTWWDLMQACGVMNNSNIWIPTLEPPGGSGTRPQKTVTIEVNIDGRWERLTGAVGNAVFNGVAGEVLTVDFTFRGRHEIPTAAALDTPTFPSNETPLRLGAGGLTIGGNTIIFGAFQFDIGATPFLIPDASHATGFSHGVVTNLEPRGTLTVSAEAISGTYNPQSWKQAGTTQAMVLTVGSGAGRFEIQADRMLVVNAPDEDRDGNVADAIEFIACADSAGDTAFEMEFKAS